MRWRAYIPNFLTNVSGDISEPVIQRVVIPSQAEVTNIQNMLKFSLLQEYANQEDVLQKELESLDKVCSKSQTRYKIFVSISTWND